MLEAVVGYSHFSFQFSTIVGKGGGTALFALMVVTAQVGVCKTKGVWYDALSCALYVLQDVTGCRGHCKILQDVCILCNLACTIFCT